MLIMQACPMVTDVRSSWGNMVPVWEPVYSQERGQRLGITRQAVAYALKVATKRTPFGRLSGERFIYADFIKRRKL